MKPQTGWGKLAEATTARLEPESPVMTSSLMKVICDPNNLRPGLCAVVRNKGAPGVDGIRQLLGVLKAHWPEIENQLFQGSYQPQPVAGFKSRSRPVERATAAFQR